MTPARRSKASLTDGEMAECRRLKPVLVGRFEFVTWADVNHLLRSQFVALREDIRPD